MGIKEASNQLNFLGRLKGSLGIKPKKDKPEIVSKLASEEVKQAVSDQLAINFERSKKQKPNNVVFLGRPKSIHAYSDEYVNSKPLSELLLECRLLLNNGNIDSAYDLIIKTEKKAGEDLGLVPDQIKKYGIYDLLERITFAVFERYGTYGEFDERIIMERIEGLSHIMKREFGLDDKAYYYILNIVSIFISGDSSMLNKFSKIVEHLLKINLEKEGGDKINKDLVCSIAAYLVYRERGAHNEEELDRINKLVEILEKLTLDYVSVESQEEIASKYSII